MIEVVRQLVPKIVTVAAFNTQLATLNTAYSTTLQALPLASPAGVVNLWNRSILDVSRPGIGYRIGWFKRSEHRLVNNGLWQIVVPVWFYLVAPANLQAETAHQALSIYWEALMNIVGAVPPGGLEQAQLTGVTPVRAIALVNPGQVEDITVDAGAAGAVPGIEAEFDFLTYTATN